MCVSRKIKLAVFAVITLLVFAIPSVIFWYWSTLLDRRVVSYDLLEKYAWNEFCTISPQMNVEDDSWTNYKIIKVYRFQERGGSAYKDCEKYNRELPYDKWYCHQVYLQDPYNDLEDTIVYIDQCLSIDNTDLISKDNNAMSDPFYENRFQQALLVTCVVISIYLCSLLLLRDKSEKTEPTPTELEEGTEKSSDSNSSSQKNNEMSEVELM